MSEEAPKDAAPKKGLPVKTIATVAVLLIVEAVVVAGIVMMFGKPSDVKGVEVEHGHVDEGEQTVEIPLLKEKFTNGSSGRMWIWDTEIIITAKMKHAGEPPAEGEKKDDGHGGGGDKHADKGHAPAGKTVREELLARSAEVRTGISAIMSSAQHGYFTEPGRETLSRQILEYMRHEFGQDPEGDERIQGVLIPRCLGFPGDY